METLGSLIILVSFAAFILGVVNAIRPQAWMKVRKRLVGLFIILGSMAGCVAGGSMMPQAPASTVAAAEKITPQAETAPAKPAGMTQAEFDAVWSQVKVKMEQCDAPLRRAGEAVGTGDVYAVFTPVKAAGEACKAVWLDMGRIEIPRSAKGEVKAAMKEAQDICENAAYLKMEAMEQMAKVLDGDARPSAMADLQDKLERGKTLASGCWISYMGAAGKADLTLPEFEEAAAVAKGGAK